jgi:putative PIN family toxin of toxin-antitoxin system
MRVVVDTNVFVSSFFGGNPRRVVDLWKQGTVTLCLSSEIVDEYVAVLGRLGVVSDEIRHLLRLFARGHNCLFTRTPPDIRVVDADPDDDKFVACAVALDAEVIVSGDKHLLSVKSYMGIKVLSPNQFLLQFR